jgi:hypothetical protein
MLLRVHSLLLMSLTVPKELSMRVLLPLSQLAMPVSPQVSYKARTMRFCFFNVSSWNCTKRSKRQSRIWRWEWILS